MEKVGNYAQFAPTAISIITVLAKKDKEGFRQLSKSAGANLAATLILKLISHVPKDGWTGTPSHRAIHPLPFKVLHFYNEGMGGSMVYPPIWLRGSLVIAG